jgi:hypothetical protein
MGWIADVEKADAARLFAPAQRREIERGKAVCPENGNGADAPLNPGFRVRRRFVPRRRRRLWIARDTPIVPEIVAQAVWWEARVWLDVELPREWIRRLAVRADVIYYHNARFRQSIRRKGNAGLNYLWAFMRRWLASMIRRRDSSLHARLPGPFCAGADLPDRPPVRFQRK